jgi:TPP-dependent pyruvate/acetoin dehydrogenase alpha subunit
MMKAYKIIGSGRRVSDLGESEIVVLEKELIDFEDSIRGLWESAKIPYPVHFSGGNERQLITLFRDIHEGDYVLSTHRGHYHYLLAGGSPKKLEEMITRGDSMHLFDKTINFMTSSIVAGMPGVAAGIARALKEKNKPERVWCFIGDGAEDEGHFYEAVRYVDGHGLPCTFVIEDNNRSVETPKDERYGRSSIEWPSCVIRYEYAAKYPHVGTGRFIDFSKGGRTDGEVGGTLT